MDYVTPDEMRLAEARAAARGLGEEALMENAGAAVAEALRSRYSNSRRRVLAVCGLGNNGGDGLAAARLVGEGWSVRVLLLGSHDSIRTTAARSNWSRLGDSVEIAEAADLRSLEEKWDWFGWADVIVDALMGTGVRGEVREPLATAIRWINSSAAARVSIDVPSGLDPLSGTPASSTVRADLTIALHRAKTGLGGKGEYTGEVFVASMGIPD